MRRLLVVVSMVIAGLGACGVSPASAAARRCDRVAAPERADIATVPMSWASRGPDWPISLAVDGDLVLALGLAGDLAAYDAASGDIRWVTPLDAPTVDAPDIGSDVVVVASGPRIAAVDRSSGALLWEHDVEPKPQVALVRAVDHETVVVGDRNARVFTLDARTGHPGWSIALDKRGLSEISVSANDEVVVVSVMGPRVGRTYVALDPLTGTERWRAHAPVHSPAAMLAGGLVILPRAEQRARLVARDPVSGQIVWRRTVGGELNEHLVPEGDDRHLAMLDRCRRITLLETATGRIVWRAGAGRTPAAVYLRLTPTHVVVNAGYELVVADRTSGAVARTEGLGLVLHDVKATGDGFVALLDFQASGVVARVDWGAAARPPLD